MAWGVMVTRLTTRQPTGSAQQEREREREREREMKDNDPGVLSRCYHWDCICAACEKPIAELDGDYALTEVASVETAAAFLRQEGWVKRRGLWYCDDCAESKAWLGQDDG